MSITPGIYLEQKKITLGTGHTAKEEQYRNFWMTLEEHGTMIQCLLLDQDFKPTRIIQEFPQSDFENKKLIFIPQGEQRYQALLQFVQKRAAKEQEARKPKTAPQKPQEEKQWWAAQEKDVQPGDLFKRDGESQKPEPSSGSSGNWWEGQSSGLKPGGFFEKDRPAPKKSAPKKKKPGGVITKKNWWKT